MTKNEADEQPNQGRTRAFGKQCDHFAARRCCVDDEWCDAGFEPPAFQLFTPPQWVLLILVIDISTANMCATVYRSNRWFPDPHVCGPEQKPTKSGAWTWLINTSGLSTYYETSELKKPSRCMWAYISTENTHQAARQTPLLKQAAYLKGPFSRQLPWATAPLNIPSLKHFAQRACHVLPGSHKGYQSYWL